jgi:adenine deaminase
MCFFDKRAQHDCLTFENLSTISENMGKNILNLKALIRAARELGCGLPEPLMYMFFLPITAIQDYAITDAGPVDCVSLSFFDPVQELVKG